MSRFALPASNARIGQRIAERERERGAGRRRSVGEVLPDARGVGDASALTEVARADRGGKSPLPRPFVEPAQRLVQRDLGDDVLAGGNVRDLLREQARSLLVEQRRGLALDDRLLEALARALALVDVADDAARPDAKRVARDRGVRRQRQRIRDGQRDVVRIAESLLDDDAGEPSAGFRGDRDGAERQGAAVDGDERASARAGCAEGAGSGHHGGSSGGPRDNAGGRRLVTANAVRGAPGGRPPVESGGTG
jgi:hypothetical protein